MWKSPFHSFVSPMFLWSMALIPGAILLPRFILPYLGPTGSAAVNTAALVVLIVLVPLMALFNIGPNFIARQEVAWRNRRADLAFVGDAAFEAVNFLPPVLMRVRSVPMKRRRFEKQPSADKVSGDTVIN